MPGTGNHESLRKVMEAADVPARLAQDRYIYLRLDQVTINMAKAGDEYGNTYIAESFIRDQWPAHGFDVLEYIPGGVRGFQDVAILRKR